MSSVCPKTCDRCGEPHHGFRSTCARCSGAPRDQGTARACETCGECFLGPGPACEECSRTRHMTRTGTNSKIADGLSLLIYCAGPSLERLRPLKKMLEELGAIVHVRTDADLEGCGSASAAAGGATSSPSSMSSAHREPRTPLRCLERGWRTPDGVQARSPAQSPERSNCSPRAVEQEHSPHSVEAPPACDAVLVLWSLFFQGALQGRRLVELSERAGARGALLLNDVRRIVEMQDRRWLLRKLQERGIPTPHFVECSRDGGCDPALEEHSDHIVVGGKRINKPFVEKPVDRRDREIYVYFPKDTGGGRALVSTRESGDVTYVCRFDSHGRVRREGSFIYQEYLQSDGLVVQAVCCGGQAYGNAVHQGVMTSSARASSKSALGGRGPAAAAAAQGGDFAECPVILRQEEKRIAKNLSVIMHQTLFGMTLVRAQSGKHTGKITSYVIDVWPGVPRSGFGLFCEEVARALLCAMSRRLPARGPGNLLRSRSLPRFGDKSPAGDGVVDALALLAHKATTFPVPSQPGESEDELLCVLVLCRHGARTPKQKAKAKVKLPSEFAAGWICGWLAGAGMGATDATEPPESFDLRAPDQLSRLSATAQHWRAAGHKLGTFADALSNFDQLGEACHAKVGRDGSTLNVAIKWGGELTGTGIQTAEDFGMEFRQETLEDIDVGSMRHDTKVYSSSEPRCQQTAAAFCKGLLRLATPALPPIIAALVRKDDWGTLEAGGGGRNYRGGDKSDRSGRGGEEDAEPLGPGLDCLETPWSELEALAGAPPVRAAFRAAAASPALAPFASPGPALLELRARVVRLLEALKGMEAGASLYNGETPGLVRERYQDTLGSLGLGESARSFQKVEKVLDHLQYDVAYNRELLPATAGEALDAAMPLCEALCDAQSALEVARRSDPDSSNRDDTGLPFLHKLRWDLRVASGADLGEEKTHQQKHEHLYGLRNGQPCVRTRLYFSHNSHLQGLLIALSRPLGYAVGNGAGSAYAVVATRLDFLAHFVIRLIRKPSSELRVICHFRRNPAAEKVCLFDLPLEEVDAWFQELLRDVPDPSRPRGA